MFQAEWLAAQMDERAIADLEDGDEEGVSFSLKLAKTEVFYFPTMRFLLTLVNNVHLF